MKIQNDSRDWVIERLVFRVSFDTDVEKSANLSSKLAKKLLRTQNLVGIC